jgi:uncharacterized protein DUF1579
MLNVPVGTVVDRQSPAPAHVEEEALRSLDFLVGCWDCEGTAEPSHLGPGHAIASTFELRRSLGDRWYRLQCVEQKTPANPFPIEVMNHWGYDRARRALVRTFHASTGAWGTAESAGFVGDTLTWLGEISQANGERVRFRQIVTKTGPHSIDERMEVESGGAWVLRGSLRCRRRVT